MCSKKLCLMTIVLITSTMVLFSGCGKNDAEPVTSEAVEESEPTEEIEEPDEEPEPEVPENTMESDTGSPDNGSIGGEDTKTDEEIEAELEEISTEQPAPSASTDGEYDGGGVNLETGEYDPYHDTNNGQGWDINGKHYETMGDYDDDLRNMLSGIQVEEEPEWWTPDQGPITQ